MKILPLHKQKINTMSTIQVTFLKECRVDNKLYKAMEVATIPAEIAKIYIRTNRVVVGELKIKAPAAPKKAAPKKATTKK